MLKKLFLCLITNFPIVTMQLLHGSACPIFANGLFTRPIWRHNIDVYARHRHLAGIFTSFYLKIKLVKFQKWIFM